MSTLPCLLGTCLSSVLFAQVFQGEQGLLIPPGAPVETRGVTVSEATVTGVGTLGGCRRVERVLINLTHTWVGDVAIFLVSPTGIVLELTSGNGGFGDNWTNTEFRDDATEFIVNGTPPYTGAFRPEGRDNSLGVPYPNDNPLGTFTFENTFAGTNADGVWQLYVDDYVGADVGEILNWEIEFSVGSGLNGLSLSASDETPCAGEPVTLSVGGTVPASATYDWSTGATSPTLTVSPTSETDYSVTVTDGSCEEELTITIDPRTAPTISGPDEVCAGTTVRRSAGAMEGRLARTSTTSCHRLRPPAPGPSLTPTSTADRCCRVAN